MILSVFLGAIASYIIYVIAQNIMLYFYLKKEINKFSNNWYPYKVGNYDISVLRIQKINDLFNDINLQMNKLLPFYILKYKGIEKNIEILKGNLYYLNMFIFLAIMDKDIINEYEKDRHMKFDKSELILFNYFITHTLYIHNIINNPTWYSENEIINKKYLEYIEKIDKEFTYSNIFHKNK